jgi:glycerophosphoryl diester phosphodiesterase
MAKECGVPIFGHRGCAQDAPENTLASVNLAWQQEADAVEIDVWLTRDGQVVAHHDETTKRTAGFDRRIVDQTLAELKSLDVGRWKNAKYAGERIPTLKEVLATIPNKKRLLIEVKCGMEAIPVIARVLDEARTPLRQVVVISFSAEVVAESRRLLPNVEAALVVQIRRDDAGRWSPPLEKIEREARRLGAQAVDLGNAPPLSKAEVDLFHAAELKVYIWTANEPVRAAELRAAGVDGLTTDRPGALRAELSPP